MKVPLCPVTDIPDEGTKTVDFFGRDVLVLKVDGTPKAIMNVCMHLGGPLACAGDRLVCQWHGAKFSCSDGRRLKGPARAGTRLMFLPTRVENDVLQYVYGE